MSKTIRAQLQALSTPANQAGAARIIHTQNEILGVQTPALRALAKEIRRQDWREALAHQLTDDTYEELAIQGYLIATAPMDLRERLQLIAAFVPKIDNWATCDSFICQCKFVKKNLAEVWQFLMPYLHSSQEFSLRFGLVMLLSYYLTPEYIDAVLALTDSIHHPAFYVRMAQAWLVATALAKAETTTWAYLQHSQLDDWTYNKALQKARESYRIPPALKTKRFALKR